MAPLQRFDPPFEIILYQPEIPPNTGNIARLCACTGARLHLVGPIGFSLDEKRLKRAGLDYWDKVYVATWESLEEALAQLPGRGLHLFAAQGKKTLWEARFAKGDILVFGRESTGLPEALLTEHRERTVRVPMLPGRRSLNITSTAAVALYEAIRQNLPAPAAAPDTGGGAGPGGGV